MVDGVSVSVVMGVYNGASHLADTIDSVLNQTFGDFEFLIIDDGSSDVVATSLLTEYAAKDQRIKLLSKTNEGLTRALVDGCNAARGDYIARVDVGDVMEPMRLEAQQQVLSKHSDCHLVTSAVSFHGPAWEPMWTNEGRPSTDEPVRVLSDDPEEGLTADVPHHGSVMFRKSAYDEVGGYRPEFYYGQDWDLWYRLAEIGKFFVIDRVLYKARFFPGAISMLHSQRQRKLAPLSLAGHRLRKRGISDGEVLAEAGKIRVASGKQENTLAQGYYFVGEALRRNGDRRCRTYLIHAIKASPLAIKSWLRLLQSLSARTEARTIG